MINPDDPRLDHPKSLRESIKRANSKGIPAPTCSAEECIDGALERLGWMLVTEAPDGVEGTVRIYKEDLVALQETLEEFKKQNGES